MKKTKWQIFINGVFKENPVLILLLGCCSVLALSVTVQGSLGMGVALTFVLACSNVVISLLRKIIIVVPLTLLLPAVGFGVEGVFLAEPISNVIGGTACYLTMRHTVLKRLDERQARND